MRAKRWEVIPGPPHSAPGSSANLHRLGCRRDISCKVRKQRQCELGSCRRIAPRRVHDNYAATSGRNGVDVVNARAGTPNDLQFGPRFNDLEKVFRTRSRQGKGHNASNWHLHLLSPGRRNEPRGHRTQIFVPVAWQADKR